jgi:hypothetical protein
MRDSGTSTKILAIIMLGIVSTFILGFTVVKYWEVDIPAIQIEIAHRNEEINAQEERAKRVQALTQQIEDFKKRVEQAEKLEASRVRNSRILARLGDAVCPVEQLYLRDFSIKQMQPAKGEDGAKMQIAITGTITGAPSDRPQKLNALFENLEKQFEVPAADPAALKRDSAKGRYSTFLGARFTRPVLLAKGSMDGAKPTEFSLIMPFEIPPAEDEWYRTQKEKSEFKFVPPLSQRDPFFVPKK